MKSLHLLAPATLALSLLAGCSHPTYYAPPPVAYAPEIPPLVQLADSNGSRAGYDDGSRDAYYHANYAPRRTHAFRDAPGYDYRLGPIQPYVDAFRASYLRAYDRGYYRR